MIGKYFAQFLLGSSNSVKNLEIIWHIQKLMKKMKFPEIIEGTGVSTLKLEIQVDLHSHTDLGRKKDQKAQNPHYHEALTPWDMLA